MNNIVAVIQNDNFTYPQAPFNPPEAFIEFKRFGQYKLSYDPINQVYSQVRELLLSLGLDKPNANSKHWNPFRDLVNKGDIVVIKPNLVYDKHPLGEKGIESMITHASVIRPIIDYLLLATEGDCKIIICDVPLQSADWENIINATGLKALINFYTCCDVKIELLDLRYEIAGANSEGVYYKRVKEIRDPLGYVAVNLGKKSYIQDIIEDYKKLEITDYGKGTVAKHHNPQKNEYLIPKTILSADLFINVPKMKTHRKAGVTLAMKNLIGINGDKSWIAHHRKGVDEYKDFRIIAYVKWYVAHYMKIYAPLFLTNLAYKLNRKLFQKGKSIKEHGMLHGGICMEGNWYGNDTVWRTIIDLNNILFFTDQSGRFMKTVQRKYFALVDGIVGMDSEGPMDGYPKQCGVLVGGSHPVAVDYVCASLMGFDWTKIPSIREGFAEKYFGLTGFTNKDIEVNGNVNWQYIDFDFFPSKGWAEVLKKRA